MPNQLNDSPELENLKKRLHELDLRLLPTWSSTMLTYNATQLEKTRSYRVLVHAEIEHFIERICFESIKKATKAWNDNKKPSFILMALITSYHSGWSTGEEQQEKIIEMARSRSGVKRDLKAIIEKAVNQYHQITKDNHGIKESNLKNLLLPVGIDTSDLDSAWLAEMDTLGGLRGEVAHTTIAVQRPIDPKEEKARTIKITKGLEVLDHKLQSLVAELIR